MSAGLPSAHQHTKEMLAQQYQVSFWCSSTSINCVFGSVLPLQISEQLFPLGFSAAQHHSLETTPEPPYRTQICLHFEHVWQQHSALCIGGDDGGDYRFSENHYYLINQIYLKSVRCPGMTQLMGSTRGLCCVGTP